MIKAVSRTLVVPRYCWSRGRASTNLWLSSGSSDGFYSKMGPCERCCTVTLRVDKCTKHALRVLRIQRMIVIIFTILDRCTIPWFTMFSL